MPLTGRLPGSCTASVLLLANAVALGGCGGASLVEGSPDDDAGAGADAASASDGAGVGNLVVDARQKADARSADRVPLDQKPAVDFPPVKCTDNLVFCEDFEGGALDPARWNTWTNGGSISFDSTRFNGGKRSLHLKVTSRGEPPATCRADVVEKPGDCVLRGASIHAVKSFSGDRINIRWFFWMDKLTPPRWFPFIWVGSEDHLQATVGINFLPDSETIPAPSHFQSGAPGGGVPYGGPTAPTQRWACWEVEYGRSTGLKVFLDEQEIPSLAVPPAAKDPGPIHGPVSLGYRAGHPDSFTHPDGFNEWIDDVAVSTQRIGCAR